MGDQFLKFSKDLGFLLKYYCQKEYRGSGVSKILLSLTCRCGVESVTSAIFISIALRPSRGVTGVLLVVNNPVFSIMGLSAIEELMSEAGTSRGKGDLFRVSRQARKEDPITNLRPGGATGCSCLQYFSGVLRE
jgi:hypothetical protein